MIASQIVAGVFDAALGPQQDELSRLRGVEIMYEQKLMEAATSIDYPGCNPRDAMYDPSTGELWGDIGRNMGETDAPLATEQDLTAARERGRTLATGNEFAINGHENRINYIVGTGHVYTVEAKGKAEVADETLAKAQELLDDFLRLNKWYTRQQEIVHRKDRDGECFLRLFPDVDGTMRVRFVEPGQIAQPKHDEKATWGIVTDPDDVETVEAYYVDGEPIDAAEIQHRKLGVDLNVKRGIPLFYPVAANLSRAEKLLRNMSIVAHIQASIAVIRKHHGATQGGVQQFVQNAATTQVTNTSSGEVTYFKRYDPGTVIDTSDTTDYEFPAQGIDASRFVLVLQAELRSIASRLVMPEFMLTSDASNANYSSTLVAEGPAVKQFQRMQWDMIQDDREVIERALLHAEDHGLLPRGTLATITINAEPPRIAVRDRVKETEADVKLVLAKIMSKETAAVRQDLVWETEQERIDEEREAADPFGGMADNPLFQRGAAPGEPADEDDEDDE